MTVNTRPIATLAKQISACCFREEVVFYWHLLSNQEILQLLHNLYYIFLVGGHLT